MIDFEPLILTFRLALITTIILLIISFPIAYWLAYSRFKAKAIVETIVSMPLVLPPSVLGFYLLVAFSPSSWLGQFLETNFDLRLVFSFTGLIVASVIYSLPFMVHPIQAGFASLEPELKYASYSLGKSRLTTLLRVLLPNMKSSLLTGIVLTFAHTIGEFGVVLMIGGNIPGETKVASMAIYDQVEMMHYDQANIYAFILFAITFVILLVVYLINQRYFISKAI
ncbi:MAG: molybdenum ABC transporter permease subunit [Saprospiraceae bacterium]|nr:MAG: molybdenum ABC transporter permease subunit [Saprospiraceae bacterium]